MTTQTQIARQFVRATILAALVAVLALTSVQRAGAEQTISTTYDNSAGQAMLCELAGGTVEYFEARDLDGYPTVTVICHGGLLDGMVCSNGRSGTACSIYRFVLEVDDDSVTTVDEIEVAPERRESPQIDDRAVVIEPAIDPGLGSEPVNPEPSPTAEPIVDAPETLDEIAPPTDKGEDAGGRDLSEIQDAVIFDDVEPDKGDDSSKGELPVVIDTVDVSGFGDAPVAGS